MLSSIKKSQFNVVTDIGNQGFVSFLAKGNVITFKGKWKGMDCKLAIGKRGILHPQRICK